MTCWRQNRIGNNRGLFGGYFFCSYLDRMKLILLGSHMEDFEIRDRVEVLITKDDRVCVAWWKGIKTAANICFPGGGVEAGDTHEQTVVKECLEEVGIQVKNISYLGIREKGTAVFSTVKEGLDKFKTETFVYTAEFESVNMKLFNVEGDGMEYEWVTIPQAIEIGRASCRERV